MDANEAQKFSVDLIQPIDTHHSPEKQRGQV